MEFGFRENPFLDSPDLRFTYRHRIFQDVCADLMFVRMSDRRGIALIEGPAGSGKTTLLATLDAGRKPGESSVTLSAHRRLSVAKMIDICADALGFVVDKAAAPEDLEPRLQAFNRHLAAMATRGGVILLIDRAEMLCAQFLEDLPRLLALGRDGGAVIHVVLAVACEDDADPLPRAFNVVQDQIHFRSWLGAMSEDEVARYVSHRMIVAGDRTGNLFTEEGLKALCRYSGGIPGRVNSICRQCIEFLTAEFMQEADARTVQRAADVLGIKPQPRLSPLPAQEPKAAERKEKAAPRPRSVFGKRRKTEPPPPEQAARADRQRGQERTAPPPIGAIEGAENVIGLPPRKDGGGRAAPMQARLLQGGPPRAAALRAATARQHRPAQDPSLALVPGERERRRGVPVASDWPELPEDVWDPDPADGGRAPDDGKRRSLTPKKAKIKDTQSRRPYLWSRLALVAFVLLLGVLLLGVYGGRDKSDEPSLAERAPPPETYAVTPTDNRLTSLEGRVADLAERLAQVQVERDGLVAALSALQLADQEAKVRGGGETADATTGNSLVLDLQRHLSSLGLDPGERDGRLGQKTLNAIARYQEQQGLKVDRRASRALLDHMKALSLLKQAVVLYHEKDYEAAEAAYDSVVRLQPSDPDARYFRGLARLKLGDTEAAIEDLNWQAESDPRLPIAEFAPARVYYIQERLKALEFDPGRGDGLYDAGTKKAIRAYQRVQGLPYDPNPTRDLLRHLEVYNHHAAAIEAYHRGDIDKAIELYDLVLSLKGDDADAYFNRGLAYRKAGKAEKALADYSAAIEHNPALAKAYYERGNLEVQEGRYGAATADYFSAAKAWIFRE